VQFSPVGSERAGVLGQAAFCLLTAKPRRQPSPTARDFCEGTVLARRWPGPPPGWDTICRRSPRQAARTNRDGWDCMVSNSCLTRRATHLSIRSALALEKFDAVGWPAARRMKHDIRRGYRSAARQPDNRSTSIPRAPVAGIRISKIQRRRVSWGAVPGANPPVSQECVVRSIFAILWGRVENLRDRTLIASVLEEFSQVGRSVQTS